MPAGISLAVGKFHARSVFHKSRKGFISLRSVLKNTALTLPLFFIFSGHPCAFFEDKKRKALLTQDSQEKKEKKRKIMKDG